MLAFLFAVLSAYTFLTFGSIPGRLAKNVFIKKFVKDFGYRSYVVSVCSAILNTGYAVIGTVVAFLMNSFWLGALVWYHVVLAAARIAVMLYIRRHRGTTQYVYRLHAYIYSGIALIVLSLAIIPVVLLAVWHQNSYVFFGGVLIYVCGLALYTVIKLVAGLVNRTRAHKSGNYGLGAVRSIGLADALISVFALQATMLVAFDDEALASVLNPVTGGLVSAVIFGMGLYMIIVGNIRLRHGERDESDDVDEPESDVLDELINDDGCDCNVPPEISPDGG